ncbi:MULTISPECIES: hypothetical protein [Kitasatospora]|uniref:Uncharacterized protein n=1 Tax=Kitasatospora cystarginea TaxID=58350 RepID=A0ABN3E7Y2_9ACTN
MTADTGIRNPEPITPLLGDWLSTEGHASPGIARLEVRQRGGAAWLRAFGGGSRDWGETPAVLYRTLGVPASALTAVFDLGFLRTVVSAHHKGGILVVTTSNVFRDGSSRADYWTREFFHLIGRADGRAGAGGDGPVASGGDTGPDTPGRRRGEAVAVPEISREQDRPTGTGPTGPLDVRPLLGRWANFDRSTTGVRRAETQQQGSRLLLRLWEADGADCGPLPVQPLAADVGSGQAIGFGAEAELAPGLGSRKVYHCGYLNRGLLTIDVHAAVPGEPAANVMYRAHFHRTEGDGT